MINIDHVSTSTNTCQILSNPLVTQLLLLMVSLQSFFSFCVIILKIYYCFISDIHLFITIFRVSKCVIVSGFYFISVSGLLLLLQLLTIACLFFSPLLHGARVEHNIFRTLVQIFWCWAVLPAQLRVSTQSFIYNPQPHKLQWIPQLRE